ncbi:hypothetical protein M2E42_29480, partial [Klebsiella pneumoniae]|nr:hypothetical protein [Klebsiella pneumoniae]
KMPAFEWVHVQLHQQKGMISLSPPTICNSAIRPAQEQAEQHIDLAYAITAHGAQGASETFAIALEGTEGNRKLMAGFESAYVALSRALLQIVGGDKLIIPFC